MPHRGVGSLPLVDANSLAHGSVDVGSCSSRGSGRSEPHSLEDVLANAIE